jgi:hypothetical protein
MELQVYTDEPVTKLGTEVPYVGITLYAYKLLNSKDPAPDEILWLEEGDAIPEGFEEYTMRVSTQGTRTGEGSGPWATCYICRYDYPIATMVLKNGHYYCTKQKCADDIQG